MTRRERATAIRRTCERTDKLWRIRARLDSLLLFLPYETKRLRGGDKEGGVADPRSLRESGSG